MKDISIIPSNTIRNHQTNRSKTKEAHQFSKEKRFPPPNPECKVAYYANDSQLSKRQAGFGYGNKMNLMRPQTFSPASTKYQHKSIFDDNKMRGKSIGLSRDNIPDRSYLIPQMHKIPGPGQYQNQVKTRMAQCYSMRPKTIDVLQSRKTYKQNPGPGSYIQINLDPKTGRFALSKFGDTKFSIINKNTPRFKKDLDSPGPLSYRQGDSMNGSAKYTLSNHRGAGTRAFSRSKRITFTQQVRNKSKQLPGPGYYQSPTQFGAYGDYKYYKNIKATIA